MSDRQRYPYAVERPEPSDRQWLWSDIAIVVILLGTLAAIAMGWL